MKIHQDLGLSSEDLARATVLMKLKMKESMKHCEGCGVGKSRQKGMNRELV